MPLDDVLEAHSIADLMTRNLSAVQINRNIEAMGCDFTEGRSTIAQELPSLDKTIEEDPR